MIDWKLKPQPDFWNHNPPEWVAELGGGHRARVSKLRDGGWHATSSMMRGSFFYSGKPSDAAQLVLRTVAEECRAAQIVAQNLLKAAGMSCPRSKN